MNPQSDTVLHYLLNLDRSIEEASHLLTYVAYRAIEKSCTTTPSFITQRRLRSLICRSFSVTPESVDSVVLALASDLFYGCVSRAIHASGNNEARLSPKNPRKPASIKFAETLKSWEEKYPIFLQIPIPSYQFESAPTGKKKPVAASPQKPITKTSSSSKEISHEAVLTTSGNEGNKVDNNPQH